MAAAPVAVPFDVVRPSSRRLPGVLLLPSAPASSNGVVVMCHGLLSHRDHNFAPALAAELCRALRCAVYRFDFRVEASPLEPTHRYRFCGFDDDVDDIMAAVACLARVGLVSWCVLGHSRGANDVLMYAAQHPTVQGLGDESALVPAAMPHVRVVAVAPRFAMSGMLTRLFAPALVAPLLDPAGPDAVEWPTKRGLHAITRADADYVRDLDMASFVRRMPPGVPVLLVHGTEDEIIPATDAYEYQSARPGLQLRVIPDAKHAFGGKPATRALIASVLEWAAPQHAAWVAEMGERASSASTVAWDELRALAAGAGVGIGAGATPQPPVVAKVSPRVSTEPAGSDGCRVGAPSGNAAADARPAKAAARAAGNGRGAGLHDGGGAGPSVDEAGAPATELDLQVGRLVAYLSASHLPAWSRGLL
jgi:pimeloyl-ACP methyl ester carboxylesterase